MNKFKQVFNNFSNQYIPVIDYYALTFKSFKPIRNEVFISAPFTSGGVYRLYKNRDRNLIFKENTEIVKKIVKKLSKSFSEDTELSVMLGDMKGWKQTDYNFFCWCYVCGINPEEAEKAYNKTFNDNKIDTALFNNYSADHKTRKKEYLKAIKIFNNFIKKTRLNPVHAFVSFPDYQFSLGCSAEKAVADYLNIPIHTIAFDKNHKNYSTGICKTSKWAQIKDKDFVLPVFKGNGKYEIILQ